MQNLELKKLSKKNKYAKIKRTKKENNVRYDIFF